MCSRDRPRLHRHWEQRTSGFACTRSSVPNASKGHVETGTVWWPGSLEQQWEKDNAELRDCGKNDRF